MRAHYAFNGEEDGDLHYIMSSTRGGLQMEEKASSPRQLLQALKEPSWAPAPPSWVF
jgi:hypothetical protein